MGISSGASANALKEHIKIKYISEILQYKKLSRHKSFLEDLSINKVINGYIYPSFIQIRAHSGRTSCRVPNVQQIPRSLKHKIYKGLIIRADYPAIEMRTGCIIAQDEHMIQSFVKGLDIYKSVGSTILQKKYIDITKEERQKMKAVVLGLIFGLSANTLVDYAKASYGIVMQSKEAEAIRHDFFDYYTGFRNFHNKVSNRLRNNGFVVMETVSGRKMRTDFFTKAVNYPVQGTAADIIKKAMGNIKLDNKGANIINMVHDELIFQIKDKDYLLEASNIVKIAMEHAANTTLKQFNTNIDIEVWEDGIEHDENRQNNKQGC